MDGFSNLGLDFVERTSRGLPPRLFVARVRAFALEGLTPRGLGILRRSGKGFSRTEIAEQLCRSLRRSMDIKSE